MLRMHDVKILKPLRIRDFSLLWTGMTVSLLGDGIYLVALAWQVYELSDAPTALSTVGVAWTAPMVVFLLLGGVVSDRFDRRKVLILSDVIRGISIAAIGVLSVSGNIELWHMFVLVAFYGVGDAFFGPAFGAIVPDIVPRDMLLEANSLGQFVRPFAMRLVGPALGGLIIALTSPGSAFLINAISFAVSGVCLWLMQARPRARAQEQERSVFLEIGEGMRFVRSRTWLWATLLSAIGALLFWIGPFEVLVPHVVKYDLDAGADGLGLVFAAGGIGAVLAAVAMAQVGLPRRHILVMYWAFGVAIGSVAGYAFVTTLWQAMAVSFIEGAGGAVGMIIWGTLLHRLVPPHLLGRVESLDWFVSISLVPVSFAVTGPLADLIGVHTTLLWAGILGGATQVIFMLIPGLFDTESDGSLAAAPGGKAIAGAGEQPHEPSSAQGVAADAS